MIPRYRPPMARVRPGYYQGNGFACDLMPDGSWLLQGDGHRKTFHRLKLAQYWVASTNREKQNLASFEPGAFDRDDYI